MEPTEFTVVTPQEVLSALGEDPTPSKKNLAYTVATEPERTRAAVVKLLRQMQNDAFKKWSVKPYVDEWIKALADAIESGEDYA